MTVQRLHVAILFSRPQRRLIPLHCTMFFAGMNYKYIFRVHPYFIIDDFSYIFHQSNADRETVSRKLENRQSLTLWFLR